MLNPSPYIEKLALDKIQSYLETGNFTRTYKKTIKTNTITDTNGDIISTNEETTETTGINYLGCPDWVLKLIVSSLDIDTATKFLISKGYLVVDPTKATETLATTKGLTDFAVQQLLEKMLGVTDAS